MGFNHWEAYQKLMDHPKFQMGIRAAMAQGSKNDEARRIPSLISGGPAPTDLTELFDVSQPTPRRPIEGKAAKGKWKTQSSVSQTEVSVERELRVSIYATLHKFYKLCGQAPENRIRTDRGEHLGFDSIFFLN